MIALLSIPLHIFSLYCTANINIVRNNTKLYCIPFSCIVLSLPPSYFCSTLFAPHCITRCLTTMYFTFVLYITTYYIPGVRSRSRSRSRSRPESSFLPGVGVGVGVEISQGPGVGVGVGVEKNLDSDRLRASRDRGKNPLKLSG